MALKGVSKAKQVKKAGQRRLIKAQQPIIHLPSDALAEVFKFLPRTARSQLALVSSQAGEAILPGVKSERRKVSRSSLSHSN